ncbi:MAG: LysR substrate-binding domain-containing protein, partial [Acidobacteriaceae bacterium]
MNQRAAVGSSRVSSFSPHPFQERLQPRRSLAGSICNCPKSSGDATGQRKRRRRRGCHCGDFIEHVLTHADPRRERATLTASGRVFLDHARLALKQIEIACEAARNVERPHKTGFGLGFLPGQEVIWLSEALRILREEASDVDVTITTKSSPELANALMQGEIDVALLRRETRTAGLDFRFLVKEPLIAILPARHRLARHKAIRPEDICREDFVSTARAAPVLKTVIEEYAAKLGLKLKQIYDAETLSGGMSLVASTGGFTLVPIYVQNSLLPSVVARPLYGEVPTIDLVMGYNKSNTSPLLKKFLLRADESA